MSTSLPVLRKTWLAEARAAAWRLGRGGALVTIDDVRNACPLPAGLDLRAMGNVFRRDEWTIVCYVRTSRIEAHGRPIACYRNRNDLKPVVR